MPKPSDDAVISMFREAARLHGPTWDEREVAEWLVRQFAKLGWRTWIDNAGKRTGSTTGNVYAYRHVSDEAPVIVFVAHMDTVTKPGERIVLRFENGRFKSNGDTELGVDNRAGVAALVELARQLPDLDDKNLLFFFPTTEEKGVMGSSCFNFTEGKIKYIFNVDDSDKPGVFTNQSLGYVNFSIKVRGVAVHAAQHYSRGVDAIKVAAQLVDSLATGQDTKQGTTLNIGQIQGGNAPNMVADNVELSGEARAFNDKALRSLLASVKRNCRSLAKHTGARIELQVDEESRIPAFAVTKDSPISQTCRKAARAAGLKASFKTSYSTSDASWLAQRCAQTIIVARGGKYPHSKQETITVRELRETLAFLRELVRLA